MEGKRGGAICIYPGCNRILSTKKFKERFEGKHLKDGSPYLTTYSDKYKRALDDGSLMDEEGGDGAYIVAQLRNLSARLVGIEEMLRDIHGVAMRDHDDDEAGGASARDGGKNATEAEKEAAEDGADADDADEGVDEEEEKASVPPTRPSRKCKPSDMDEELALAKERRVLRAYRNLRS